MNQHLISTSNRADHKNRLVNEIRESFAIWAVLPALVAIAILWYPFGFAMGAMLEDWGFYNLFNEIPTYWNSFPGNPIADLSAARPFQLTPFVLAKLMTPDSFVGSHLLLMLACALKVIASAWIGYFAFRDKRIAFALGLLVLVYPADTQQMSLRTMNISLAEGLMLSGLAMFMRAMLATRSNRRVVLVASSVVACVLAGLIYEPFLPLYATPLLLVWSRYGARPTWGLIRRRRWIVAFWCIAPAINAAYLFYAMVIFKTSYQNALASGGILHALGVNYRYLWTAGFYRVFVDSWRETVHILHHDTIRYGYIALVFVVIGALATAIRARAHNNVSNVPRIRLAVAGVCIAILAYAPFMVDEAHTNITQRTFMGAAFGAALFLVAVATCIFRKRRVGLIAALTVAITLGFTQNLYQFDSYTRDYLSKIRPYTSYLADKADWSKQYHLVFDHSGLGGYLTGAYFTTVTNGPKVRTHHIGGNFFLCEDEPASIYVPFYRCSHAGTKWTITMGDETTTVDDKEADLIRLSPDVTSYTSRNNDWRDFEMRSERNPIFRTASNNAARYVCRADSMWGYSYFCQGEGWSDGRVTLGNLSHEEWFGAISPAPTLYFTLMPEHGVDYELRLTISKSTSAKVREELRVAVNGQPIALQADERGFRATVPHQFLKFGENKIAFHNALPAGQPLGLVLNEVDLVPSVSATPEHR
jgi:hypothetical protein